MTHSGHATRQTLIDTAAELIWKNSFGSVSVDGICQQANVKKGSFYHFFESKSQLAVELMEAQFQQKMVMLEQAFASDISPHARLENMVNMICEHQAQAQQAYGRVCGCPFWALGSETAGHDEAIREKVESIARQHQKYLQPTLEDLVQSGRLPSNTNSGALAETLYAYVSGELMMARIKNSLDGLEASLLQGVHRVLGLHNT